MNTNKHENLVSTIRIDNSIREKFKEWENILVGEDIHSISNQIWNMIQDSAFFQCLNESRKYTLKDSKGEIKQNKMLHHFINQSFFKTQLLSIRRLIDKDFGRVIKGKEYTVYSLYNLIEDIKKHSDLFTRQNILLYKNLPYDYGKARSEFDIKTDYSKGTVIVPHNIGESELTHNIIDSITGKNNGNRSPKDLIPMNILKPFEEQLISIQELYGYVGKYIAHASIPEKRKEVPDEIDGALGKVLNSHKVICETASFIGSKLLFCGFGTFLPIPQFDLFEYLDEPIVTKETIKIMRNIWIKYLEETRQWNQLFINSC